MATRLKTVEYWFPYLATGINDNTDTNLSQITIYLPENSKTFRSVVADVVIHDRNTTVSNINRRQVSIQLGAAGYSAVNGAQVLTQGGEQQTVQFSGDFTSYFQTNWSGASMTCDARLLLDTAAASPLTPSFVNSSVRLTITYEYDDTSSVHVKTVRIPLDAPTQALATTKPGTAIDTLPVLDTYCPEASKTFRQLSLVIQGNTEGNSGTDKSISFEFDTLGAFTSYLYECGSTTDMWYRVNEVVSLTTNQTHDFYLWASIADFDHPQVWLVATYEFDPANTTTVLNSLVLPMELAGTMGGTSAADFQRATRELWIQEPGPITLQRLAALVFFDKLGAQTGLNARVGTGSFVGYTDVAAVLSGGAGLMVRNDSAFTFARGRNSLSLDIYNTDATDRGFNVSVAWLVNYTSGKASQGVGAHNHTVVWNLKPTGTVAAAVQSITPAVTVIIPETDYFLTSVGVNFVYTSNSTSNPAGVHIGVELLSAEGGLEWANVYEALGGTDPEVGIRQAWGTARSNFKRFRSGSMYDLGPDRIDLMQARRWRLATGGGGTSFDHCDLYITYHTIAFTVSGTVAGSNGGTVTLSLERAANGERLLQTSRVGNGAYSFTWFDNTEDVYVDAYEDGTHMGRSAVGVAEGSP